MKSYEEAVKWCHSEERGFTDVLIQEIGEKNYHILRSTGLIKHGVGVRDHDSFSTWEKTVALDKENDFYWGEPTEKDVEITKQLEAYFV